MNSKVVKGALSLVLAATVFQTAAAEQSIARVWNEEALAAIRIDKPHPPVHARNLFHLAVGMYDAWAAYDSVAIGYIYHERLNAPDVPTARREAISYAAYRLLRYRYGTSVNAVTSLAALDRRMEKLGYSTKVTTTLGNSPAALGNRIAAAIVSWGLTDGCNQIGAYDDPSFSQPQPSMPVLRAGIPLGGGVPPGTNPNLWQPLTFDVALTQNGLIADKMQKYQGVTWLDTRPFALERVDEKRPWIDLGPPCHLGSASDAGYKQNALAVLRASSLLNSNTPIDISPGSGGQGNNSLGADDGKGRTINPVTNTVYTPNLVKTGDYARVLAEFWADGPKSETPPGHWHVFANQVADHPLTVKRIGGKGPLLDDLEWDVKMYFAVSASLHDAACAAWSLKRCYMGTRPITMIRYMGSKGQSSDPTGLSYDPAGLPLEAGVAEIITPETAVLGGRHYGVGAVGEIAVYSWPGEPADPKTQTSRVRWMRGVDWLPYQRKTFNNPAFPGYVSGHSTFSRAAAEILTAMTGSEYFPGGLSEFRANANSYLVFERGPSASVTLQWATYYDAADQAGASRRLGGIHTPEDDFTGRIIGSRVGKEVWSLVCKYWDGSILNEEVTPEVVPQASGEMLLQWKSRRGLYYKVEADEKGRGWVPVSGFVRATNVRMAWKVQTAENAALPYRIVVAPMGL